MAKSIEKIREAYNKKPIEGVSPGEMEEKMTKNIFEEDLPGECVVVGCNREQFRWQPRCKIHHLEWIAERELENEEHRKARERYLSTKKGKLEQEMASVKQSVIYCQLCSSYMRFSDKVALERAKLPKHLSLPRNKYLIICEACDAERS